AAIRETWGKQLRSRGVKLLFLVASTSDENLQDNIIEEDNIYGDLLQASFIEDYYNLTLKTIAMLDSLRNYCSQVKFVLKTDQDVLINVEKVFQVVDRYRNEQRAIFGNIFDNVVVRRNENDKWYVPKFIYSPEYYPPYASGPVYIFTGDSISSLISEGFKTSALYVDDSYFTGIVAEKAGIKRIDIKLVSPFRIDKLKKTDFNKYLGIHNYKPGEIIKIWKTFGFMS
ncbi:beta-1:3-galactosyltransferase 1-like protein, partial [Dinothrombium tinctorium]